MTESDKALILLTNDDGIKSPGLWAAAEALSHLGFVTVAAPREQKSGAGRSMPPQSDGKLREEQVTVHGKTWKVYAVGGTPAQAVQHGILELMPRKPDLVVAGINYGENLTISITVSGTIGAALEGAAFGIPSMAVSLEMPSEFYLSHSRDINFDCAAHFTQIFAQKLLRGGLPDDVEVLKIDVPSEATEQTPWRLTRLSRKPYYIPVRPKRRRMSDPAPVGYEIVLDEDQLAEDSDVYVLRVKREVSVTPLSLDMTSRVDLKELETFLHSSA
jgi:5'-nucleotidase